MVTAINLLEDGDHGMICGSLSVLVTIAKVQSDTSGLRGHFGMNIAPFNGKFLVIF